MMAFELTEVVNWIANISMAGIHVKDFATLPNEFDTREFPLLAPDSFAHVVVQSVNRDSLGDGTSAKQTIEYTIPYVLAYAPQGAERGVKNILPGIVKAVSTVMTALIKYDTPDTVSTLTVDLQVQSAQVNVTVNDPIGHGYHGAKLVLRVKEFVEGVE